jgi:two-component sensor histidine kinase
VSGRVDYRETESEPARHERFAVRRTLIWIKNWLTLFVRLSIYVASPEAFVPPAKGLGKMRLVERTFSIRTVMLTLVCGGVIVMLGAAFAAGWLSYREYRERIGGSLIAASQAVMVSVDNELDEPLAFVSGLSSSSSFARGDFNNFQERARDALSPRGYFVIIKSADGGQEYVNTSKPPPASSTAGPSAVGLLRLDKAGNSHLGRVEDQWMELLDVPIEDESGRRLYTMVIGVPTRIFQDMLTEQHFPRTWSPVILDADWTIVARGISPENFVGQKAAGEEFRNAPSDRTHEVRVLEGEPAMSAYSHSSRYGWTTAIAISDADLFNQAIGPGLLAALGGLVAVALVIAMAALFSTYLARAIKNLAQMVRGFPEATLEWRPDFRLHEMSLVARSMREAAAAVLDSRKVVDTELNNTRRLNQLSTLLVGERNSFEDCLAEITKAAIVILEADKGNLQLFDAASGSLTIAAQQGFQEDFLKFFASVRGNDAACGAAMGRAKQIIVDDVLTSEIFVGQPAQKVLLDAGLRAVVSTPLMSSKLRPLGVLSTHFTRPRHPSERQLQLINILARQAADYLERKEAERTHQTILSELQHRSNNLLTVIQSIAQRSLGGDHYSLAEAKEAFEARLHALARANRALLRSNWGGVDLDQLVHSELEAFSRRATIAGPSVVLTPQTAQNFTLVLHELATNSAKHGALSSIPGKITVSWTVERSGTGFVLKFKWQESGGPPVAAPMRQGFGTKLLKAVFSEVRLEYPVDGLRCEIDVPLTSPVPSQAALAEDDAVIASG